MFRLFEKINPRKSAITSWNGIGSFYVKEFRNQLDTIADKLTADSRASVVYSRFNPREKSAELVTDTGEVVARVYVTGECGVPEDAIVTTDLSDKHKELFSIMFPKEPGRITFKSFSC